MRLVEMKQKHKESVLTICENRDSIADWPDLTYLFCVGVLKT